MAKMKNLVHVYFVLQNQFLFKENYYWHKKRTQGSLRYSRSLKSTESYLKLLIEYYKFMGKTKLSLEKKNLLMSA